MTIYSLSAKNCMSHLLLKETFYQFSFIEAEFTTWGKFRLDGYLQEDFFDEKPEEPYARWEKARDFCFQIIRGKRTPLNFKIILALPADQYPDFLTRHGLTAYRPENIHGLYLNFHYDGTTLHCTTGTALTTFTLDKTLEQSWDQEAKTILKTNQIEGDY